jgi:aminoglycoside phosphotransferase family enzyme/predicted kinase
MNFACLIEQLSSPRAYPVAPEKVEVHHTHISVVFVTDHFAYKIKKPVVLDFLDYGSLEKRRHWCEEEVRLNRRLAPSIYEGVVPITAAEKGAEVCVEGTGTVIEWAVKMLRLPSASCVAARIAEETLGFDVIDRLARRIAEFHRHAERNPAITRFGRFDVVARNARENFEQSTGQIGKVVSDPVFQRVRALTDQALGRERGLIEERAERGVPCDAHGDLRADHVYLFPEQNPPNDIVIVDAIEFNERFRAGDPIADAAFLVMDLIRNGRRDLAARFARAYFDAGGDRQGELLLPLYVSYRAAVRAKVSAIKALSSEVGAEERERAHQDAVAHWFVALEALEEPERRPCLILVAGLPGSGKSTLARSLASQGGFTVVRSDQVRKELAQASANAEANQASNYESGIYTPEWNERTYSTCLSQAKHALWEGKRVIVDATFRHENWRRRFLDMAQACSVPGALIACQAEESVVKKRLEQRTNDLSDADWAIYRRAATSWEPAGRETRTTWHTIDTTTDQDKSVARAVAVLRDLGLFR